MGGERRWGIRLILSLTVVSDLHAAEVERIVAAQPFADVQESASHHLLYRASRLLVIGQVRRTGPRRVSVRALRLHAVP
ncbi:hypothetical protein GTQ99_00745 [Kineococcus sp. T13]|uniref:hypothetical protein n=1 Tax=Kineococcus vitellinus TaxID=2696565 RepID=UPI001412B79F|nr:hypothetical protein [Kineococcus vitellinus]NAZ73960.1 hypothetical protein [Kineococcus vitellinus]